MGLMSDIRPPIPRTPAPELALPLVGGGVWSLKAATPKAFSLLTFYRGWHCPICRDQLMELQSRLFDFERLGVSVTAISTDDEQRASATKRDWRLDRLDIAHGLTLRQAREWGLYISTQRGKTSLGIVEPDRFNEPGLFLVKPDGTLYSATIQSVPFARPSLHDLFKGIEFVLKADYPARGEVVSV